MKRKRLVQRFIVMICLCISTGGLLMATQQEEKIPIRFQSLNTPPGFNQSRLDAMGQALEFQAWPQTEVYYVAPVISRNLLSEPGLMTRSSTSYSHTRFDKTPWGLCRWSWGCLVENKEPLPTELPPDRRKKLLERLPREQRNDPDFVEKYLKRKLERYRKSLKNRLDGEMNLEICLAPDSRAAQEYLLFAMMESSMPTEALVSKYASAERPEGLGTVSFVTKSPKGDDISVMVARDNIYLKVRGSGCFAGEVQPLARKIDAMIIKQSPLTREQLLRRRPSVEISHELKKQRMVSYEISEGRMIASVRAFVDGQHVASKDGRISLSDKKGKVRIEVIVISGELLASSIERELSIGDE